jgi:hypothetical protein
MSVNEGPLQAKWSDRLPVVSENVLLAAIACGFLLVHILTMTVLMQATGGVATPPQEQARPSSYD